MAADSREFNILSALIETANAFEVKVIERVVNPHLWRSFVHARRELLLRKSRDASLLKLLGASEAECQHALLDNNSNIGEFADNVALLIHGSRSNLDVIFAQGLDNRLGNGGLLGRGIYFADDPLKSLGYDSNSTFLIFAVLLGDCVSYSGSNLVREPEKEKEIRRTPGDLFFDSIVGRPGPHNEFVIYDKNRCCPLYAVSYHNRQQNYQFNFYNMIQRQDHPNGGVEDKYQKARKTWPPFIWSTIHQQSIATTHDRWPFYARDIFSAMGTSTEDTQVIDLTRQTPSLMMDTERKLDALHAMGFKNYNLNKTLLQVHDGDLDTVLQDLTSRISEDADASASVGSSRDQPIVIEDSLEARALKNKQTVETDEPIVIIDSDISSNKERVSKKRKNNDVTVISTSAVKNSDKGSEYYQSPSCNASFIDLCSSDDEYFGLATAADHSENTDEKMTEQAPPSSTNPLIQSLKQCDICAEEYGPFQFVRLPCSHEICTHCHDKLSLTRTTMSGIKHSFLRCPFCQAIEGVEVGDCPTGTMRTQILGFGLPGFERDGTIQITYSITQTPYQTHRTAYLPNNTVGQRVLSLLKVAWDRRLVFRIGRSATTGVENVPVWAVHHKTSTVRAGAYGFPDDGYFGRVIEELKLRGVE